METQTDHAGSFLAIGGSWACGLICCAVCLYLAVVGYTWIKGWW